MVTIKIGKKGLTDNIIKEINLQLEKRGMVKVKMLRSFRSEKDKRELVDEIKAKVKGKLVDLRGFVLTFERC
ncbi:RNA-binding protein [Archaeoglobales archaeon]|nr:MAG: RNA-binding protein [Archaeoglobales archaeon]